MASSMLANALLPSACTLGEGALGLSSELSAAELLVSLSSVCDLWCEVATFNGVVSRLAAWLQSTPTSAGMSDTLAVCLPHGWRV
jgi:hypothetical protein